MKTNRMILMLAVSAAVAACNQAEIDAPSKLNDNQFTASVPVTKVSMNEDFSLFWEEGDEVSVFAPDGSNNLFTSDAQTGAATTVLHGGADFVVDPAQTYYAIYPYSADNTISEGKITTVIPVVQTPKVGTFPVNHAVAVSSGKNLAFYNVCGLIGFEITRDDIVSVTLKSAGEQEYLTGKVEITCQTEPSYAVLDGHTEVTLVTQDKFVTGKYYVAVLPQTFTGMTVTMYKKDGTVASRTNTAGFTLERSKRVMTGAVDGGEFGENKITTISNASELQGFLAAADNYAAEDVVTLAADIDLKGYDIVPAASFAGTFDGASKSIKNWNTTTALFNEVSGTVKDLTIAESCNLEVQVKGDAAFIALSNTGTISGCTNYGTVTSVNESFMQEVASVHNDRMVGTITAVSTGVVENCENHGEVALTPSTTGKYTRQYIGGVVGQFSASSEIVAISNCKNNAPVSIAVKGQHSGKLFVGGVCGGTPAGKGEFGDYGKMSDCTNKADVSISAKGQSGSYNYINLGGVVGYAEASLLNCDNESPAAVSATYPVELPSSNSYVKRPAVGGVAGTVLLNADNCDNSGTVSLIGAVGAGDSEDIVGMGFRDGAYVGGVVAFSGHLATNTMNSCSNTGNLNIEINMRETDKLTAYIGGISGNALAQVTSCTNNGTLNIKNRLHTGYAGGIVGMLGASGSLRGYINSCSNNGAIDYDAVLAEVSDESQSVNNQSSNVYIGGVAGHMAFFDSSNKFQTSHNNADGDLRLLHGLAGGVCYVGGLAGYNGKNITAGGSAADAKLMSSGNIVVDTRMTAYVGGIFGRTSHQVIDVKANMDEITVTNPGASSMIGGICGDRQNGGTGDARMYMEPNMNITVTCLQDNGTHFGIWNGRRAETQKAFHSTYFKGSVTYTNVTFGVLVGYLQAAAIINVGSSGNVNIQYAEVNGADLPEIAEADYNSKLFGTIEADATISYVSGKLVQ